MSVLCIKSFLDHGHAFQLFTYRNYDNIPAGTLVRDARDILPEEAIFHDSHNSLAPFSDWFRMKFLSQEGGFWVDMDVICLGDELPSPPLWYCKEWAEVVAVGALLRIRRSASPGTLRKKSGPRRNCSAVCRMSPIAAARCHGDFAAPPG